MASETNMTWGASVLPAQPALLLPETQAPSSPTVLPELPEQATVAITADMPPPPPLFPRPTMLVRQIRDQYWLESEEYMRNNPDLQECEVLTSQIQWGWVYRIVRHADGMLERISEYKTERDFRHPNFQES